MKAEIECGVSDEGKREGPNRTVLRTVYVRRVYVRRVVEREGVIKSLTVRILMSPGAESLFGNYEGRCFRGKGRMAGATKENIPGGSSTEDENPPGGGSFVRGRRWLVPYSPLRGCSELAALATAKIPRRSAPRSFQTGSQRRGTSNFSQ